MSIENKIKLAIIATQKIYSGKNWMEYVEIYLLVKEHEKAKKTKAMQSYVLAKYNYGAVDGMFTNNILSAGPNQLKKLSFAESKARKVLKIAKRELSGIVSSGYENALETPTLDILDADSAMMVLVEQEQYAKAAAACVLLAIHSEYIKASEYAELACYYALAASFNMKALT